MVTNVLKKERKLCDDTAIAILHFVYNQTALSSENITALKKKIYKEEYGGY